jgi:hypothetical protein
MKKILLTLMILGSFDALSQEKILVLKCTDIDNEFKQTWDVVINDVSKTIAFYDRTHSKNYTKSKYTVSAERVKTYGGNTTYYEFIKYDFKSKMLTRTTTEVPLTSNHPRLNSSETYSTVSKCKKS